MAIASQRVYPLVSAFQLVFPLGFPPFDVLAVLPNAHDVSLRLWHGSLGSFGQSAAADLAVVVGEREREFPPVSAVVSPAATAAASVVAAAAAAAVEAVAAASFGYLAGMLPSHSSGVSPTGDLATGVWRLASGYWRLATGDGRLATGVWRLASGVWRVASGDWQLASGDWRLATGLSSQVLNRTKKMNRLLALR